jgi:hypothetical protein
MIIIYNPIAGSGPFRVIFEDEDLLKISAKESPDETGMYWHENGKLIAIQFDEVDADKSEVTLTVPESHCKFVVKSKKGSITLESPFLEILTAS